MEAARNFQSDEPASSDDGGTRMVGRWGAEGDGFGEHGFVGEIEGAGEGLPA
jgi:hypothetical protein